MGELLSTPRVLGDRPFAHVGRPSAVASSPDGEYIAVGGDLGPAQWPGHDVQARSRPHCGWIPIGIYRSSDLACLHAITTHWDVGSIAFHPDLPLVAIGTGSYDGGYAYEGELLLLDLESGRTVSVLDQRRQVHRVAWHDAQRLELVLAPPSDDEVDAHGEHSFAMVVERDDWSTPQPGMIRVGELSHTVLDGEFPADRDAAQAAIESLCADHGLPWRPRSSAWAVHPLADGRILAALEGAALECWSPSGTETVWTIAVDGIGCQIAVNPDGNTVLSNVFCGSPPARYSSMSLIREVESADGTTRLSQDAGFPAVIVTRTDGWSALRDVDHDRRKSHATSLMAPDGRIAATVDLGTYDLFNHYFDIRYAPDLLFLQGPTDNPWRNKWVVAVDPPAGDEQPTIRRLFPLAWEEKRGAHLFGGAGVYLDDQVGPSIIHTGAVHDGAGLLRGNSFVVRRAYPEGKLQWVFAADNTATAIDRDGDTVYVAYNTGELVALDAHTGAVLARQPITVAAQTVVPLSLAVIGPSRIVIGTLDGRVLDYSFYPPST